MTILATSSVATDPPPDPIRLEVFKHLFASIAEEMGVALRRTGYSPNIKERRDYSCALFDAQGQMIAQGAHMPVHLGAMPMSVQAALAHFGAEGFAPGDVVMLNDPFCGGTHLPDITLISPIFVEDDRAGRGDRAGATGATARVRPYWGLRPAGRITPMWAACPPARCRSPPSSTRRAW